MARGEKVQLFGREEVFKKKGGKLHPSGKPGFFIYFQRLLANRSFAGFAYFCDFLK